MREKKGFKPLDKQRYIPKIGNILNASENAYSDIDSLNVTARLNMASVRLGA